jgi:hypothetical protein
MSASFNREKTRVFADGSGGFYRREIPNDGKGRIMKKVFHFILCVCLVGGLTGAPFSAEIEIDKTNLHSVENLAALQKIMPQDYNLINSMIMHARQGCDSFYEVNVWLEEDQSQILSATLTTPDSVVIPFIYDSSDDDFDIDGDYFYFTLTELSDDFPPGTYTLTVQTATGPVVRQLVMPAYDSDLFPDFIDGDVEAPAANQVELHWQTVEDVDEYEVWAANVKNWADVYNSGNLYIAHPQNVITPLTKVIAGKGDYMIGVQTEKDIISGEFGLEYNTQTEWILFRKPPVPIVNAVQKCDVKAGKTRGLDSISMSGLLDVLEADFLLADDGGDQEITISVDSDYFADPKEWIFPITSQTLRRGVYTYSDAGKSFSFDSRTGRFAFSAGNCDLTGLTCPIDVSIEIGDYVAEFDDLGEGLVNGTKPCPPQLLMGAVNSLQVSRPPVVTFGKTIAADTLTVDGYFTIEGTYDDVSDLVIHVGDQDFTVDRGLITSRGKMILESCANAGAYCDNSGGLVTATFDFSKCTFRLTLRNATLTGSGIVPFGFTLFDKDLTGFVTIDLGAVYTYWEVTGYDQAGSVWEYDSSVGIAGTEVSVQSDDPDQYEVTEDEIDASGSFYLEKEDSGLAVLTEVFIDSDDLGGEISLDCDLIIWPDLLRPGQTWTGGSSLSGYMSAYGYTIYIVDGIASAKVIVAPALSRVTVPAGTYDAVKYDETWTFQGYLEYSSTTVGTIQITLVQSNYAVPDLGVVKRVRKLSLKGKIYGGGGTGGNVQDTYLLNHE